MASIRLTPLPSQQSQLWKAPTCSPQRGPRSSSRRHKRGKQMSIIPALTLPRLIGDLAALGAIATTVLGMLPTILSVAASVFACVWYGIQIYNHLQHKRMDDA